MKNPFVRRDTLRLEMVPLHTEKPQFAAHAAAQVKAACERGAHVIGFTELHPPLTAELGKIAESHGYRWVTSGRDTGLAVKNHLSQFTSDEVVIEGRARTEVSFDFHGSKVTVFGCHWDTNEPKHSASRAAYTSALILAMRSASAGKNLAFFMGDCNPTIPQRFNTSEPRKTLEAGGLLTVYTELGLFPNHIGATVIGRSKGDTRVKAVRVTTYPPLGSDHLPAGASFSIRRLARHLVR